jgi:exopolysaccharide biosynthesis polyprenyl glycosylphosphotransferase
MPLSTSKLSPEPATAPPLSTYEAFPSSERPFLFVKASRAEVFLDVVSVLAAATFVALSSSPKIWPSFGRSLWFGPSALRETLLASLAALLGLILSLVVTSWRLRLYSPREIHGLIHEQQLTIQACTTAGLLLTGILYSIQDVIVPRRVLFATLGVTSILLCVRRLVHRLTLRKQFAQGVGMRNVLIVGNGPEARALGQYLDKRVALGYNVKGFATFGSFHSSVESFAWRCTNLDDLFQHARRHFVDEIFFTSPCETGLIREALEQARLLGIDLHLVLDMYDGLAWSNPIEYIDQFPIVPLHRRAVPELALIIKRIFDVIVAITALLLAAPIMILTAIAIKIESPGPVFYLSERAGKKGQSFRCIKFRTMVQNAEQLRADVLHMNERDTILFKISKDPRITKIGKVLRKYSIDELPQFFNVLRGEMSVVGPRPPLVSEFRQYGAHHLRRLDVTPGITGLWQIQGRQDPSFESYISLDFAYIESWSVWLDISIILRTVAVVFAGTGS